MKVEHRIYSDEHEDGELVSFPAHYEKCGGCFGKGRHVNRAIDGHGLGAEDFEDEDFREGYFSGRYDVSCEECNGAGRVAIIDDEATLTPALLAKLELLWEQEADAAAGRRESEMERRMGA